MIDSLTLSVFAAAPAAARPPGGLMDMALPMILMVVIFYFLIIRPQRKRAKDQEALINALKNGDQVVTAGGIHGLITGTTDTTVSVKVADGISIKFDRSSVVRVNKSGQTSTEEEKSDK